MLKPEPLDTDLPLHTSVAAVSPSDNPAVLADILQDSSNIAIWERNLPAALQNEVENLLISGKSLQLAFAVTPKNCLAEIEDALRHLENTEALSNDIAQSVDMFCYLFDLKHAGLRLTALDRAMCPRFHVDRVPCRLVTTYLGNSTQWLPHGSVDRSKLGKGSSGLSDEHSGLYHSNENIQQLTDGDVALLKGELWEGSQGFGLVHRSPTLQPGDKRLLLTLDFLS